MNMRTEKERQNALQEFNKMSDYYDKYRPDYPEEMINIIINRANLISGSKLFCIPKARNSFRSPRFLYALLICYRAYLAGSCII